MVSSETWTAAAAWVAAGLTAVVAGPDLWDRMHGAKIEVSPPRQVLLYRDGTEEHSIMWVALDTTLLNRSRFPDTTESLVLRISGAPPGEEAVFRAESTVEPIFSTSEDDVVACPEMTRCIRKKQMTIGEERADGINISGGTALSIYISFPLSMGNCISETSTCAAYADFDSASGILEPNPDLRFTVELSMAEDGRKYAACVLSEETRKAWPYIIKRTGENGWATGNCI